MVTESQGLILSWMGDPDAPSTLRRAVQLSHEVGMKRFEMVSLAGLAAALRRSGARDEALALAREAWQLCVEVGAQAFAGPLALLEIAAKTPDAGEAESALQQAEEMLMRGAVAHNHLFGLPDAMRLRMAQGRHDQVLRLAGMLEAYAREEPTRGPRTTWTPPGHWCASCARPGTRSSRRRQRRLAQARTAQLVTSAQEIEQALAELHAGR